MELRKCPRDHLVQCTGARENEDCCRITPPGPVNFSVARRNPLHWDIYTKWGRAFRIRGEEGDIWVGDEREMDGLPDVKQRRSPRFKSVNAAMIWIVDLLMSENTDVH